MMAIPPSPDLKDDEDSVLPQDSKMQASHINDENVEGARVAKRVLQAPELVLHMSAEERASAENRLVRKIDLRLLPMVILMYIMNYLDRNNIAAARIAGPDGKGLQDELGLSSEQYQVSFLFQVMSGTV
jgi:hypothetical protein